MQKFDLLESDFLLLGPKRSQGYGEENPLEIVVVFFFATNFWNFHGHLNDFMLWVCRAVFKRKGWTCLKFKFVNWNKVTPELYWMIEQTGCCHDMKLDIDDTDGGVIWDDPYHNSEEESASDIY